MNGKLGNVVVGSVVILAVLAMILGLGAVFQSALKPLDQHLAQLVEGQKSVKAGLTSDDKKIIGSLLERVTSLESQVMILTGGKDPREVRPPEPMPAGPVNIPVDGSYILGDKDARVTIVVFDDFQCPFCSRFHAPLMEALKAFPEGVNFIFKHFPLGFHDKAKPAAKAALAAGVQGKFYEMTDKLFENASALEEAKFADWAEEIGLDRARFEKDYKERDAEWEKKIQADINLGQKVRVGGTPTYFLNGVDSNARSTDEWKAAIAQALEDVQAPVAE